MGGWNPGGGAGEITAVPVPINEGGTGAATASTALAALGGVPLASATAPGTAPNEYWVTAGSKASDANSGDFYSPFATLAHAVSVATAAALPYRIHLGYGNFPITAADGNGNGVTVATAGSSIVGVGIGMSVVQLNGATAYSWGAVIDNVAQCKLEGFSILVGNGSTCTYGFGVTCPNHGGAESCTFRDLYISATGTGTYVNGYSVAGDQAAGSPNDRDIAETLFDNCQARTGITGAGFLLGTGTSGQVVVTKLQNCTAAGGQYGVYFNACGAAVIGGNFNDSSVADYWIAEINDEAINISGCSHGEGSTLLLGTAVLGNRIGPVSLRDVIWTGTAVAATGVFLQFGMNGPLTLDNVMVQLLSPYTPVIQLNCPTAGLSSSTVVHIRNMASAAALSGALFSFGSGNYYVTVEGYIQTNDFKTVVAAWGGIQTFGSSPPLIGAQVAYASVAANFTSVPTAANTWVAADSASGASPTITLPNDGNVYRIELIASLMSDSLTGTTYIGIGTAATSAGQLVVAQYAIGAAGDTPLNVVACHVVGSGQVLKAYVAVSSALSPTVTIYAANVGSGVRTPCALAAYRVA